MIRALAGMFSKLDGPTRFLAPFLPAPRLVGDQAHEDLRRPRNMDAVVMPTNSTDTAIMAASVMSRLLTATGSAVVRRLSGRVKRQYRRDGADDCGQPDEDRLGTGAVSRSWTPLAPRHLRWPSRYRLRPPRQP